MRIAAIDIGSNAARLLINEITPLENGEAEFTKLNLLRIPLRLGMDVFSHGKIRADREEMLLSSMKVFSDLMKIYKIEHYRACATSAMRDASNGQELIEKVEQESGIQIEIISGDEEASLIYENHIAEKMDSQYGYLYIDVGGGSTELMYFKNQELMYKQSFNIGTIRLLNNLDTPLQWQELKQQISQHIAPHAPLVAIGSGGNINKLFSISKTKEGKPLSLVTLRHYLKELEPLSVEQRMLRYHLREDRADVLVPALKIFTTVMELSEISKIYVPKISVADGLIHQMYKQLSSDYNTRNN